MKKHDLVQRFLFDDTDIRGEIVFLEDSFQSSFEHQHFPRVLIPVFGEFLAGATLLSEVLKFEGILTLQARGSGLVSMIMAESNHRGEMRGIVRLRENPDETPLEFDDLRINALLGDAILTITIDPIRGQRYQGIVPVNEERLAHCLENYFSQSEQLLTQIQLFADEKRCGGLFLQCLPPQLVTDRERREDLWNTCTHLASTLSQEEIFTLTHEQILTRLFNELPCRVFEPKALQFKCSCDRERSANALQSLGLDDAIALLQERDIINIDCQFCGKVYAFGERDLRQIFPSDRRSLH